MSTRAFAVFQDSPTEDTTPKPSATSATDSITSSQAFQEHVRSTETILSPTLEKENLHPVTGLAAPPPNLSKKRKMSELGSVLATKVLAPTTSKPSKSRELKRRASTSSASGKSKAKSPLDRKASEGRIPLGSTENGSSSAQPAPRRPSRALSRQPTLVLGTVPEEPQESTEGLPQAVKQALIDSRCYELTVKPLADVSTAYLQSSDKHEVDDENLTEYRVVKEKSGFEHKLRDYFTSASATASLSRSASLSTIPSSSSISTSAAVSSKGERVAAFSVFGDIDEEEDVSSLPSSPKKARKESDDERNRSPGPVILSTPERRQLYASFTFVTPKSSPTKSK